MNIKKIILSLAFVLTLFSVGVYAKTLEFEIGSQVANVKESHFITTKRLLAAPYIDEGRTVVPVRVVSEELGAKVGWDEAEQKVTIRQNGKNIVLVIGSLVADVNGEAVKLDVAPVIKNGATLVPLRFVSENLGYDVKYINATKQVIVTDYPYVASVGNSKISYDEFEIMYNIYMGSYYNVFSQEEIVDLALESLRGIYALYNRALEFGVELSDDDYTEIVKRVNADMKQVGDGWLKSVYADIITKSFYAETFTDYIYQIVAYADIDPEEYYNSNYMQAKHVYISKDTENAKNLALEISGKASRGTDFDLLVEKYSQDNPSDDEIENGYIFIKGEVPEIISETVSKLKVGKTSGVVETNKGYYIIKRVKLTPYASEFETPVLSTAIETLYNNYINEVTDGAMFVENMTCDEILNILSE